MGAGPISVSDCGGDTDPCYSYLEDNCSYTGDRLGNFEPPPGDVSSIEECRLWGELIQDLGAVFFHYISTSEECHLYATMQADCQAVGGPKSAPDFEDCRTPTTSTTSTASTASTTSTTVPATTTTTSS